MGGMADFSGCLALQMPVDRCACVAAGPREDQRIRVQTLQWNSNGETSCYEWPLAAFYQSDGQIVTTQQLARKLSECRWVRHVAGVCLSLLESGDIPHLAGGANLLILSDIPDGRGLASSAAIQVAVAQAIAGLFDIELETNQLLRACRCANAEVAGGESGLVDHVACLLGEPGSLLQVRGQPDEVIGALLLPKDVSFAAIDSGPRSGLCRTRYYDNRVASLMGRAIIEQICSASTPVDEMPNGYLAGISPADYVMRFRNELPVKMRGSDFVQRYGPPAGLDGEVEPDQVYKIRSRTEHHIYENDRAHRFVQRLARARRTGERDALVEAGELMYASHWSYSQRCGMGSLETDALVQEIRSRGPTRGLYGAKITGMGCGGTVAVLMSSATSSRASLEEACASYAARTGRQPALIAGSSPGAKFFGRRFLD
jgi:L-arabinokinase